MRRDMDLCRKVLIALEHYSLSPNETIDGYSTETVGHHCYLLRDARLAAGGTAGDMDTGPEAILSHVTSAGHEFVDLSRSETTWTWITGRLKEKTGALAFDAVKAAWPQVAGVAAEQIGAAVTEIHSRS